MARVEDVGRVRLQLQVNGKVKQDGNTANMLFSVPELIEYTSARMRYDEGDVLLTGTPAGVGPLVHGDVVECRMWNANGEVLSHI